MSGKDRDMAGKRDLGAALKGQVKPRGGTQPSAMAKATVERMQEPTDEQMARCEFVKDAVRDEGVRVDFAYRRRPLIESMADKIGLTMMDMAALRYFRAAFDRVEVSATKSCLDVGVGGGGGNGTEARMLAAAEANVAAKQRLARCEAAIGAVLPTMRAVVLFDRSFSDVAMDRFGSRKQEWLVDEVVDPVTGEMKKRFHEKLVPRSDYHRKLIASEFKEGMRRLVAMLGGYQPLEGTGDVPAAEPSSAAPAAVTTAVRHAINRAAASDRAVTLIWMAPAALTDLARERGVDADDLAEFGGLPIVIREDWTWGWLLCGDEPGEVDGACVWPTQVA